MVLSEIRYDIESIKDNKTLYEETNFVGRIETLDYIDFHIIDRIDMLLQEINDSKELFILKQRANRLKQQLEKINAQLFINLRANIRSGVNTHSDFKREINKYLTNSLRADPQNEEIGYDILDLLINGIFFMGDVPAETKEREAEMVFYQKTPARIIFELAENNPFSKEDIFYDLGSGLGQVCILVNLLSGITSKGIEFEPEFFKYASACASGLNLKNIEFINADARHADYSDGTVFFMYTPFTGRMLDMVLKNIHSVSQKRMIRIFTYGPCSVQVGKQSWLICTNHNLNNTYGLYEFRSEPQIFSKKSPFLNDI